ncbi:hypothetical protein [Streptomyces sp. AK08-02]|uniref:hypothetical protein n=1 Tax=Streptomyces sp. AK08-02 TaxID=3028654 RepID=UPI0029BA7943|nr:hypothetical protein [Streptomyces sp. AK08-02]MDX3749103.1 hypothetical protein [Streptomyces sp. AK08-02]
MGHGVYFLANDRVYDNVVAFLNSFRASNPTIDLCLIPFADDIERTMELASRYDFTVFDDEDVLRRCDEIGARFHGRPAGHYRKLAAWHGEFDRFVYIDCDTVVLEPVDFVFGYLDEYDFLTSHSDIHSIRKFVWRDSIYDTDALTRQQIRFSANTGFVVSHLGAQNLHEVEARLDGAVALADHMELMCFEQPLLNYLIVTSGRPYTSLFVIAQRTGDSSIPQERWAGAGLDPEPGPGPDRDTPRPPTMMVHWAGEWERSRREGTPIPLRELWERYRYPAVG